MRSGLRRRATLVTKRSRLWVPAARFVATSGTAAVTTVQATPGLNLANSADTRVAAVLDPDSDGISHWVTFNLNVVYANNGAGSGNLRLAYAFNFFTVGDTHSAPSLTQATFAAGAQNVETATAVASAAAMTGTKRLRVTVQRTGTAGTDTLGNAIAFLGVELVQAS